MKHTLAVVLMAGIILFTYTGCVSFTTFQTPDVMEEGEYSIGLGASGYSSVGFGILDLYGRMGLGPQMDLGVKVSGIPPLFLFKGDVKYQFLSEPLYLSGSMGVSYMGLVENTTFGFYPMVMTGTDRFYGGVKSIIFSSKFILEDTARDLLGDVDFITEKPLYGAFIGAKFGNKLQVLPEVNVYTGSDIETLVVYGIGLGLKFSI